MRAVTYTEGARIDAPDALLDNTFPIPCRPGATCSYACRPFP